MRDRRMLLVMQDPEGNEFCADIDIASGEVTDHWARSTMHHL